MPDRPVTVRAIARGAETIVSERATPTSVAPQAERQEAQSVGPLIAPLRT